MKSLFWKPNDRALCINDRGAEGVLVVGRWYFVTDVFTSDDGQEEFLMLTGMTILRWSANRFLRRRPACEEIKRA